MPDKIPQLNLTPDIEGASVIYDLQIQNPLDNKNIGLATSVLNILAIEFRDTVLKDNFNTELAAIHNNIYDAIQNPSSSGYLLELVIYVDENGFLTLPQGRIINPIGIGSEPLDAMANYLNTDRMQPGGIAPAHLKSNSSFLWITKNGDRLTAASINKEFYSRFIELAHQEANTRNLMGQWISLNTDSNLKEIQIAQYWSNLEKKKKQFIEDAETRDKIEKLTGEMAALQEKTNELYIKFQKTQEEMVKSQKLAATLSAISTVAGLIKTGIELEKAFSSSDKPLKNGTDDHLLSLEETITINKTKLNYLGTQNTNLTITTQEYLDKMGNLHRTLSAIYHIEVQPVPHLENNPLLLP